MRRPERIPIILDIVKDNTNKKKILEYFFKPEEGEQLKLYEPYNDIDYHVKKWEENFDAFEKLWLEYDDLRLTQVLISSGILPNYPGSWFYKEDSSLMIDSGLLEPRDIYFWGRNFDKDLNQLEKTEFILIKDMTKDHIKAILKHVDLGEMRVNEHYIEFFKHELTLK